MTLDEIKLILNKNNIIDTEKDFAQQLKKIYFLAEMIRRFGQKRYKDSVYRSGSLGNYFCIARKFKRLEGHFEAKEKIKADGDTLLDTYIDLLNYSIFGILIGLIEEDISEDMINKKLSILEEELL